ncbi:hypothetical protein [Streptomyces sp. NBC_01518]|uniref:hypothetical protein n=1 Tax=Streptomyces sp. NBC_01518 TaxID=2903891 RepID=UPI00386BD97D
MSVLIRDVEVEGRAGVDLRVGADGRISEMRHRLEGEGGVHGWGGALLPGLQTTTST